LFALLCMLFMVWTKKSFCMDCRAHDLKMWEMCLCEYTRSYVRLFPLIGLVVALVVASRTLLRRHFFYQMLKHRVVVRLQSKRPLQDWLFWVIIVCLLHVLCHFILDKAIRTQNRGLQTEELGNPMCWKEGLEYDTCCDVGKFGPSGDETCWKDVYTFNDCCVLEDKRLKNFNHFIQISVKDAKLFNIYYCAPAICFMIFLWTSYDVEQTLLPLSKFMEGDAEQARERLTSISVINEGDAHRAVKNGLSVKDGDDGYQLQDLCRRLAEHAEQLEETRKALHVETRCPTCGAVLLEGGGECARCAGRAGTPTAATLAARTPREEVVDFTKSWWIAEMMIDRRLKDDESRQFRLVWYTYSTISLVLTALVACCFIVSMWHHVKGAAEAWEKDQLCVKRMFGGCAAVLLHLCVAMHVGADFVMQEWNPLREAAERKLDKAKETRAANRAQAKERRGAPSAAEGDGEAA